MAMTIEKAALYEKYRLPYAERVVADLFDYIGAVQVIADIGAGTGQLARLFAQQCTCVYAVEPDPAMRRVAATALADWANVEVRDGCGEQSTLAASSVDLIVVGNAFHRFRPEACAELRRILRPSGWVALFSHIWTNRVMSDLLIAELASRTGVASRMDRRGT
jgi:SAM-dependent methyltransferase